VLGGFGLGEDLQEREHTIQELLKVLPDDKPRMIEGLGTIGEVMQCVLLGIDLINSAYPDILTDSGYALVFSLTFEDDGHQRNDSQGCRVDPFKINMRDKAYATDNTPILSTCSCYACINHTRAYLHHLLCTHEMLAAVLLSIHNTHHYLRFFETIQHHIAADTFVSWYQAFLRYH